MDVVVVVSDAVVAEPFAQAFLEKLFVEILAPQGAEADAGLVQAAVQVEHADQPGHSPDQLATVRMGPRWLSNPAST